jgi:eukaryotic-like serine/threonine-protein kinase
MTVPASFTAYTPEQQGQIDSVCTRFEQAWRAGDRPDVAAWVAAAPDDIRLALVRELVRVEMEQRWVLGEPAGDYGKLAARYPAADVAGFVAAELAGTSTGPWPAPGEQVVPLIPGYRVLDFLGEGGMGSVWLAEDVATGRVVALKLLRRDRGEQHGRFAREARRLAQLGDTPGVLRLWAVGEHDGRVFFTMEYCAGGSLQGRLAARLLDPREAAGVLHAVAAAVHRIHAHGIVHRDLTPANILFAGDGTPKVADFGLAKLVGEASLTPTGPGQVLGTVPFLAPEQAAGDSRNATAQTDVYALGAILYKCLTGKPPFQAATIHATLRQICDVEPAPPTRLNPAVPGELAMICLKCLNKQPGDRYKTAADLAEDLQCFLDGVQPRIAQVRTILEHQDIARQKARRAVEAALDAAEAMLALDPRFHPSRLDFLRVSRDLLAELCRPDGGSAEDRATVADAHQRVAEIDRKLGRHSQAEADLRRAVALARDLVREHPAKASYAMILVRACSALAHVCSDTARHDEADDLFVEALGHAEGREGPGPSVPAEESWAALALNACLYLGKLRHIRERLDDAQQFYARAIKLSDDLCARYPGEAYPAFCAAQCRYHLGLCLEYQRKAAEADACYGQALDIAERLAESGPAVGQGKEFGFLTVHVRDIELLVPVKWDRRPLSEPLYFRAVVVLEKLVGRFPDAPGVRRLLAIRRGILGNYLRDVGRSDEGEPEFRAAVGIFEELCRSYPELPEYPHELAHTHMFLGQLLEDRRRPGEAAASYERAETLLARLVSQAPAVLRYAEDLARARARLSAVREGSRSDGEGTKEKWGRLL